MTFPCEKCVPLFNTMSCENRSCGNYRKPNGSYTPPSWWDGPAVFCSACNTGGIAADEVKRLVKLVAVNVKGSGRCSRNSSEIPVPNGQECPHIGYVCTRERDHTGPHVGYGGAEFILWEND